MRVGSQHHVNCVKRLLLTRLSHGLPRGDIACVAVLTWFLGSGWRRQVTLQSACPATCSLVHRTTVRNMLSQSSAALIPLAHRWSATSPCEKVTGREDPKQTERSRSEVGTTAVQPFSSARGGRASAGQGSWSGDLRWTAVGGLRLCPEGKRRIVLDFLRRGV